MRIYTLNDIIRLNCVRYGLLGLIVRPPYTVMQIRRSEKQIKKYITSVKTGIDKKCVL